MIFDWQLTKDNVQKDEGLIRLLQVGNRKAESVKYYVGKSSKSWSKSGRIPQWKRNWGKDVRLLVRQWKGEGEMCESLEQRQYLINAHTVCLYRFAGISWRSQPTWPTKATHALSCSCEAWKQRQVESRQIPRRAQLDKDSKLKESLYRTMATICLSFALIISSRDRKRQKGHCLNSYACILLNLGRFWMQYRAIREWGEKCDFRLWCFGEQAGMLPRMSKGAFEGESGLKDSQSGLQ